MKNHLIRHERKFYDSTPNFCTLLVERNFKKEFLSRSSRKHVQSTTLLPPPILDALLENYIIIFACMKNFAKFFFKQLEEFHLQQQLRFFLKYEASEKIEIKV
jgi:hypothetical protein